MGSTPPGSCHCGAKKTEVAKGICGSSGAAGNRVQAGTRATTINPALLANPNPTDLHGLALMAPPTCPAQSDGFVSENQTDLHGQAYRAALMGEKSLYGQAFMATTTNHKRLKPSKYSIQCFDNYRANGTGGDRGLLPPCLFVRRTPSAQAPIYRTIV